MLVISIRRRTTDDGRRTIAEGERVDYRSYFICRPLPVVSSSTLFRIPDGTGAFARHGRVGVRQVAHIAGQVGGHPCAFANVITGGARTGGLRGRGGGLDAATGNAGRSAVPAEAGGRGAPGWAFATHAADTCLLLPAVARLYGGTAPRGLLLPVVWGCLEVVHERAVLAVADDAAGGDQVGTLVEAGVEVVEDT